MGHAALAAAALLASAGGLATGRRPAAVDHDEHEGVQGNAGTDGTTVLSSGGATEEEETPRDALTPVQEGETPPLDEEIVTDGNAPPAVEEQEEQKERPTRDRARRRQRAAEEALSAVDDDGGDDRTAAMMPLVRHMSALTKELTDAHQTIGRVKAERDALRHHLAELTGEPVPALVPIPTQDAPRPNKEARVEARAAKQAERSGIVPVAEIDPELAQRADEVGRRRRLIALAILATVGLLVVVWRLEHWPVPMEEVSKGGLQTLPYVGTVFSLLMGGFLVFRLIRVGTKARGWLFPEPEPERRRRRR